jgi:phosphocarrier protein HPr
MNLSPKTIVDITRTAGRFQSSIVIRVQNKHIDVKSILGLSITLMSNDTFKLEIHGPDEAAAKAAMEEVFTKHDLEVELV